MMKLTALASLAFLLPFSGAFAPIAAKQNFMLLQQSKPHLQRNNLKHDATSNSNDGTISIEDYVDELSKDLSGEDKFSEDKTKTEEVRDAIKDGVNNAAESIQDKTSELKEKTEETREDVKDGVDNAAENIQEKQSELKEKTEETREAIKDGIDNAAENIQDQQSELKAKTEETRESITDGVDNAAENIDEKFNDKEETHGVIDTMGDTLNDVTDKVKDITNKVVTPVKQGAKASYKKVKQTFSSKSRD